MYYIAKVKFETINDQNGKPKTVKEEYLVAAESVSKVEEKLNDKFGIGSNYEEETETETGEFKEEDRNEI